MYVMKKSNQIDAQSTNIKNFDIKIFIFKENN